MEGGIPQIKQVFTLTSCSRLVSCCALFSTRCGCTKYNGRLYFQFICQFTGGRRESREGHPRPEQGTPPLLLPPLTPVKTGTLPLHPSPSHSLARTVVRHGWYVSFILGGLLCSKVCFDLNKVVKGNQTAVS